jgi:LacI family transcriptional regulator
MAMGAYDAIKELGLAIPRDVAVVGFDNREVIAAHLRPGLTTIALPYFEMGTWAVGYLLNHEETPDTPAQIKLACPLIRRQSV